MADRGGRHLIVLVLLLAAVAQAGCGGDDVEDGGPLAPGPETGTVGSGIRLDPGEVFTDRTVVLFNHSQAPARIDAIRPTGTVGRLRRARVLVALGTASTRSVTGAGEGFPPRGYRRSDLHAPKGFVVPPSDSKAGRLGVVVITSGSLGAGERYGLTGYDVDYTVGKTRYRTWHAHAAAVCAAVDEDCEQDNALLQTLLAKARERAG